MQRAGFDETATGCDRNMSNISLLGHDSANRINFLGTCIYCHRENEILLGESFQNKGFALYQVTII